MSTESDAIQTRSSLLARLPQWKDEASWQDFFDTYWKLIYSVALRSGLDDAAARDVVQETVLTVAKNIGSFKKDPKKGSFKAWLLNTTRWRIMDQLRSRQRNPLAESRDQTATATPASQRLPDGELNLGPVWEEEWQKNLLDVAIEYVKARIKPKQFQIFDCLVLKGWTMDEVKRVTGANAAQIYFARHRVQAEIKKEIQFLNCLEQHGFGRQQ